MHGKKKWPPKQTREAERRKAHPIMVRATRSDVTARTCCGRGRAPRTIALAETARRGRARLSALRHGSCPGSRTPRTRSRPRFTRKGGRGRYPRRSPRLSQAPGAPVWPKMPAGTMPGPPECEVASLARGNRARSTLRIASGKCPFGRASGARSTLRACGVKHCRPCRDKRLIERRFPRRRSVSPGRRMRRIVRIERIKKIIAACKVCGFRHGGTGGHPAKFVMSAASPSATEQRTFNNRRDVPLALFRSAAKAAYAVVLGPAGISHEHCTVASVASSG